MRARRGIGASGSAVRERVAHDRCIRVPPSSSPPSPASARDDIKERNEPMDLVQALRPTKLRVIFLAAVLAVAGLVFAAGQAGPAHAAAGRVTRASAPPRARAPRPRRGETPP